MLQGVIKHALAIWRLPEFKNVNEREREREKKKKKRKKEKIVRTGEELRERTGEKRK